MNPTPLLSTPTARPEASRGWPARRRTLRSCILRRQPLHPTYQYVEPARVIFGVIPLHVQMPAHHKGFRRYTKPSPSKPCVSPAWLRPYRDIVSRPVRTCVGLRESGPLSRVCGFGSTFFVMTKLVPARPDTSVRSTLLGRWDAREENAPYRWLS